MRKLNNKEEQIMQILWRMQRAFVKEIVAEMEDPKPPTTTVSSIVRKLETEGWIGFEPFGKTHRYYPIVQQTDYVKSSFKSMIQNYFGGSAAQLLSYFVKEEQVNATELNKILKEIEEQEKDN